MGKLNPLRLWLDRAGETPADFAERAGITCAQVYQILRGRTDNDTSVENIRFGTYGRVVRATKNEVTFQQLFDWIKRHERRKERAHG